MSEATRGVTVRCPQCGREVVWGSEAPFRPFCGERCRTMDLGSWASEHYVLPEPVTASDDPETESP